MRCSFASPSRSAIDRHVWDMGGEGNGLADPNDPARKSQTQVGEIVRTRRRVRRLAPISELVLHPI